jgi:hypothetical protein
MIFAVEEFALYEVGTEYYTEFICITSRYITCNKNMASHIGITNNLNDFRILWNRL